MDNFGHLGIGDNPWKVLLGDYVSPEVLDPYTEKLLQFLQMHQRIKKALPVSTVLSTDDYIQEGEDKERSHCKDLLGITLGMLK